jgi:hypothetical protein
MRSYSFASNVVFGILIMGAGTSNASTVSYTDRSSFLSAAGNTTVETFNNFSQDTSFRNVELDLEGFSMIASECCVTAGNFIDVSPFFGSNVVNDSPFARIYTSHEHSISLTINFDVAVTSFGADFRGINDSLDRTQWLVNGETISLPVSPQNGLNTFFGIVSDTAFTTITFVGIDNGNSSDLYGMDNVTYSGVPIPAAVWLFGSALAGLGWMRRRQTYKAV